MALDVVDFGADPTGAADSTSPFMAAGAASQASNTAGTPLSQPVHVPAGRYRLASTFTWGPYSLLGEDVRATEILWAGPSDGTVIQSVDGWKHKRISNINFRSVGSGALNKPRCWIDASSGIIDWGASAPRCSFGDLSAAGTAAIILGQVVNAHFRDLRFDVGHGACIEIRHSNAGSRSFSLTGFTVDSTTSFGGKSFRGIIYAKMAGQTSHLNIELAAARIETNSGTDWASDSALVTLDGDLGVRPASINLRNLTTQLPNQAGPVHVVRQTVPHAAGGAMVIIENCDLGGLTGVLGGSWSPLVGNPPYPSGGQIGLWATARQNSGATNTNWLQLPSA